GPHGRYQLEVSPGTYRVSTVPGSPAFTKLPFEVHVWEGETSRAYFPLNGGPICGGECLTPSPDSG
ncbi:MAG: hypothetical protein M3O70_10770, partial [Actinomycetota bacterium]|nr:hypothetical protein [Actinomycetota bacterium]